MKAISHDSMYLGKTTTASNAAWHRPQSSRSVQEEELMQSSARALQDTKDLVEKVRLLSLSTGTAGIMGLGRALRHTYDDDTHCLYKEEFFNCIKESGLQLADNDIEEIFQQFDTDGRGFINVDEFMAKVRPPMSASRRDIVRQVFTKLDRNMDGIVTLQDLHDLYQVKCHPRYMSGEESADLILDKLMAIFEKKRDKDGKVSLAEFMNYYSGISVSIDSDGYFDLMMRQAYKL